MKDLEEKSAKSSRIFDKINEEKSELEFKIETLTSSPIFKMTVFENNFRGKESTQKRIRPCKSESGRI